MNLHSSPPNMKRNKITIASVIQTNGTRKEILHSHNNVNTFIANNRKKQGKCFRSKLLASGYRKLRKTNNGSRFCKPGYDHSFTVWKYTYYLMLRMLNLSGHPASVQQNKHRYYQSMLRRLVCKRRGMVIKWRLQKAILHSQRVHMNKEKVILSLRYTIFNQNF